MYPWQSPVGSKIWKNQAAFMVFLRGLLRRGWNHHPLKLEKIKKDRYQIPNPNPRGRKPTVWGFDCACCGKTYPIAKECQVDHIVPAGSLINIEDIQGFVERLLVVTEDNLRLVCKACNGTLAYADRQNITFEEAVVEKQVIEFGKNKSEQQKKILVDLGLEPGNNASHRKDIYRMYLKSLN